MLKYISSVIIMNKTLMNKFTHLLELTTKKKQDSIESKILLDDMLSKINSYLDDIDISEFEDRSRESKKNVLRYDSQFFRDNLPLQEVLTFDKKNGVYETNPFKLIEFDETADKSIVDYSKIITGPHEGNIGFNSIIIAGDVSKLSYGFVGHELVHTQIEKNPYTLTNYYNGEVLSMFVEMIISKSLSKNILNNYMRYRFRDVHECLIGLSRYEEYYYTYDLICKFRCYLSSSLKALHLYDIYINSNKLRRIEILGLIEDVFNNKITVEDFLNKMEITYNNSKDIDLVKEYVKRYK